MKKHGNAGILHVTDESISDVARARLEPENAPIMYAAVRHPRKLESSGHSKVGQAGKVVVLDLASMCQDIFSHYKLSGQTGSRDLGHVKVGAETEHLVA